MLISNLVLIGNKLLSFRKRLGLTQAEVAEVAGISDRTYADIERGSTNMRMETFIKICEALHITPDEILADEPQLYSLRQEEILTRLKFCNPKDKETAFELLYVFLKSLE